MLALGALALAMSLASASAAELPYTVEPVRSLTGDCSTSQFDPEPDPDCQPNYPLPPTGPSGRFNQPTTVAIDPYGNEYVGSVGDARIDIFDEDGSFITELALAQAPLATAVDSKGNLYVFMAKAGSLEESEVQRFSPTGEYKPEEGKISYGSPGVSVAARISGQGGVAVDPSNDHLYIAWSRRFFEEYGSAEDGNVELATITDPALFQNARLAVDGERRRIYASTCRTLEDCYVLVFDADAPHALLDKIEGTETPLGKFQAASGRLGLAVDESNGHVFVADLATRNVYEFDETYKYTSKVQIQNAAPSGLIQPAVSNSPLHLTAENHRYLFVPQSETSGNAFAFKPPAEAPADVESAASANIGSTEAELQARINPGTDPEEADAEYVFEYVTAAQWVLNGFDEAVVAGGGSIPNATPPRQVSVFVRGLEPGTDYRFRVVAENGAGGDEEEGFFGTYSDSPITPNPSCENGSLRTGGSALLPDCRAYELVTPADTNGNPVKGGGAEGDRFGSLQVSPAGGAASFELLGGTLPGFEGTGFTYGDPYRASRSASGWSIALVGPTGAQTTQPSPGSFSPDQGYNFWLARGEGTAVGQRESHYVHYPDGHSAFIGRGSLAEDPFALGRLITEDGEHIVFETVNVPESSAPHLEPNAPPEGTIGVYDRTADEVTHVISLLPGDITPAAGQNAKYLGASADGNGIAFRIGSTLYLRVANTTTYEIATTVDFAGVSEGGTRVFYVEAGDLFAYDVAGDETIQFTETGDIIPVNVAPGGTRAYFVSQTAIVGSGENPKGAMPQAGEQNLYLSTEGTISFVGIVTERDVEGEENSAVGRLDGLGLWIEALETRRPGFDPSRLNPDGSVLLFQSRADLDGYDPDGVPQIYRYDSAGSLDCISCPPTKAAATGGAALQSFILNDHFAPFGPYSYVPNLRADGNRAFFESAEALVSGDTDEKRDVYEWEESGVGSCANAGGCVYLISSGHSENGDYLFGHSESGDDVFITTNDILVGGDQTTISIYDARAGGGFAQADPVICQGEGCRPTLSSPPPISSPESGIRSGSGNRPACRKGKRFVKRKGKVVCVKKEHHRKSSKHKHRKGGRR